VVLSSSSVGRGIYSIDNTLGSSIPPSSLSWLETNDGHGRRKKYTRGIVSGRTFMEILVRKAQ